MAQARWILIASFMGVTACGGGIHRRGYEEVYYVETAPPAAQVEVVTARPGVEFAWVPGYWRWNRRAYVWAPGRWERVPKAGASWVPGQWQHARRGWYFVPGHWR